MSVFFNGIDSLLSNLVSEIYSFIHAIETAEINTSVTWITVIVGAYIIYKLARIFARNRDRLPTGFVKLVGTVLVIAGAISAAYGFLQKYGARVNLQSLNSGSLFGKIFAFLRQYIIEIKFQFLDADLLFSIAIILGVLAFVVGIALIFAEYERSLSTLSKSLIGNILLVCFGVSLAFYPLAGYSEGIITLLCINAIAAMGVSLLTGFAGVFSLGHAAYMALGAYTAAILTVRHGVHWLPGVVAGGIVAMAIAWAIGWPTLKLVGDYYTIASIGLGEAIRLILENWQSFTRGARGFPGIHSFTTRYVAVGFLTIMGLLMFNLIHSKHGREFKAVRDDVTAASMMGFNTPQIRVFSLVISAFYCGVAGALLAGYMSFIQPAMFDMMKSTELTSVVVFGGLGSMSGTLLGTSIITLVTELFRPISQYRMFIYGLILVLVMVFRPEGILGNREIWQFFYRKKAVKK